MRAGRRSYRGRVALLLAATLAACGGPDICLQCPTGTPTATPEVIVTGTITNIVPNQTPENVTVVICLNLAQGGTAADCKQSYFASVAIDGTFTRNNVPPGPETIFFWIDTSGDGMIDPSETAKLTDSQGLLSDVQSGQTVTLSDVNINFSLNTATANISISTTPTPTPTAFQPTPTPAST